MPYTIEFAECVKAHFRVLTASQRTLILDSIEKQLIAGAEITGVD